MRSLITSISALSLLAFAGTASAQARPGQLNITPVAISIGQTINGALTETDPSIGGHFDCYVLSGPPGTLVEIAMRSETLDSDLEGDNLSCGALRGWGFNTDGNQGRADASIKYTLTSKPLIFRARNIGSPRTGAYTLSVTAVSGGAAAAPGAR